VPLGSRFVAVAGRLVAIYEQDGEMMLYDSSSRYISDYVEFLASRATNPVPPARCGCRKLSTPGIGVWWATRHRRQRAVSVAVETEWFITDIFFDRY
jgi:hypothetical protein